MKLPDYIKVIESDGVHMTLQLKRTVSLWFALWKHAYENFIIPVYRWPHVAWVVTKAWWNFG